MSLIVTGKHFEQPTIGLTPAVFSIVADLGTRMGKFGEQIQVVIIWELSEKMREGENAGEPFQFSKFYNKTISDRSDLGKMLASFRGKDKLDPETVEKGIDLEILQGLPCQLNLVENDDGKVVLQSVLPLPETMKEQAPPRTLTEAPEWVVKLQQQSREYKEQQGISGDSPEIDDDLPF